MKQVKNIEADKVPAVDVADDHNEVVQKRMRHYGGDSDDEYHQLNIRSFKHSLGVLNKNFKHEVDSTM